MGAKTTAVWDRSRTHDRSTAVARFLRRKTGVRTERFPGCAPNLNPDEGVWDCAKYARMADLVARGARHLRRKLECELGRPGGRPDLLAPFIRHSGLAAAIWRCSI